MDETAAAPAQQTISTAAQEVTQAAQQHLAQKKETFMAWIQTFLTWGNLFKVIGAVIVILILWFVYKLVLRGITKASTAKLNVQRTAMLTKSVSYIFYTVLLMYILSCFGIKLTALLGAAGVVGLAVGFAAQTTVSNLISGIFVLGEGVMKMGDFINVGGITGTVDSIDLLSTKVHTPDNQMVRIPNASIINTNFQNNSYFDKRRMTFAVCANYNTDIQKALDTFMEAPARCPTVLQDPAPAVWVDNFGSSNVNMTVAVWSNTADFIQTKNDMFIALMKVMKDAGISMAYNCIEIAAHDDGGQKIKQSAKKAAHRKTAAGKTANARSE
jgi:small-conductance mechanosensitive channel